MASTSGFQLVYSLKSLEDTKLNSKSNCDSIEKTTLLGNTIPRNGFSRSQTIGNFQATKKNVNEIIRCDSTANRASAYQSFDGFLSRHYLHPSYDSRFSKPPSSDSTSSPLLKRTISCPNLSETNVVEYELKYENVNHLDNECTNSECSTEECIADGHRNCENQMPSRRITGLFSRSASISQALATNGRFVSSSIIQAARPAFRFSFVNGFAGIIMAFFFAAAGVLTALKSIHNQRFSGAKDCRKCSGEGAEQCRICNGSGQIIWEGKLFHYDPCPSCFGNGLVKCGHCKPRRFKGLTYTPAGLGLGIERS